MSGAHQHGFLPTIVGGATRILAIVAGVLVVMMVLIICTGVITRYFFATPILGVNEIVQLNAVALAMLALPYVTFQRGHVRADIFDKMIGKIGRLIGDVITRLLSMMVLIFLVMRAWDKAADAFKYGDATNMLNLPLWPFISLISVGAAITMVVFAAEILEIIKKMRPLDE